MSTTTLVRGAAAAAMALGLFAWAPAGAQAAELPPTSPGGLLDPSILEDLPGALAGASGILPLDLPPAPTFPEAADVPAVPGLPTLPLPGQDDPATPDSDATPSADPTTPGLPGLPALPGLPGAGTGTGTGDDTDAAPSGGAVSTPLGDLCFLAPQSGTAVRIGAELLGQDFAQQLLDAAPQAFAACPEGASGVGPDDLGGGALNLADLLGLCVRVTETVAPLQTSLVLLDQDLIATLTDAGLPLQQLVVPCPSTDAAPAPTPTPSGGAVPGPDQTTQPPQQNAAIPVADTTDTGRLAFTGSSTGPYLLVATALLCAGGLLVQRSRLGLRRR